MENLNKNLKPVITQAVKTEFANTIEAIVKESDRVSACSHIVKDPNVEAYASALVYVNGKDKEQKIKLGDKEFTYNTETYKCTQCGKEIQVVSAAANTLEFVESMIGFYEMSQRVLAAEKTFLATDPNIVALGDITMPDENGVVKPLNVGERLAGLMTGIIPPSVRSGQSAMSLTEFGIDSDIMRASDIMQKELILVKLANYKKLKDFLTNKSIISNQDIRVSTHTPTLFRDDEQIITIAEKAAKGPVNKLFSAAGRKI